jgi:hypothetical protein
VSLGGGRAGQGRGQPSRRRPAARAITAEGARQPRRPPNACAGGPPAGTWDPHPRQAIVEDDSVGAVEWMIGVDSSHVRGPPAGCGGRRKGAAETGSRPSSSSGSPRTSPWRMDHEHPSRRRRARPTNVDPAYPRSGRGQPAAVAAARPDRGRPRRTRPGTAAARSSRCRPRLLHRSTRSALHRRGIGFSSFEWRDQIAQRQAKGSREGRLRYAERAAYYPAEVVIASFVLWLRRDPQDGPPR